jgi:hypothetical protein
MMAVVVLSSIVVAGAATAGDFAPGDFVDGNKLFEQCQSDDPQDSERWVKRSLCLGYIAGVADALDGSSFCLGSGPTGVRVKQVDDVVYFYLRDHPEHRHNDASSLVTAALKEKFPCN